MCIKTEEKYYVYRLIDDMGCVVYVGKTKDIKKRIILHRSKSKKFDIDSLEVEWICCLDSTTMDYMEKYFISKLRPIHNIHFSNLNIVTNIHEFDNADWKRVRCTQRGKTKKFSMYLSEEVMELVTSICKEKGIKKTDFIRNACLYYSNNRRG